LSVVPCTCKVAYDFSDAKFPATVKLCQFHAAAAEMFEVLDAIMGQTEQVTHHRACHCIACRAVKVLFKARGKEAICKEEEKRPKSLSGSTR
jgi:hypothetical protein